MSIMLRVGIKKRMQKKTGSRVPNPRIIIVFMRLIVGNMMTWNNRRYLHGREGFTMTEDGERHLETGYVDWDELRSRRRVIQRELGL